MRDGLGLSLQSWVTRSKSIPRIPHTHITGAGKCRTYELYVPMFDCFVPARSFSLFFAWS